MAVLAVLSKSRPHNISSPTCSFLTLSLPHLQFEAVFLPLYPQNLGRTLSPSRIWSKWSWVTFKGIWLSTWLSLFWDFSPLKPILLFGSPEHMARSPVGVPEESPSWCCCWQSACAIQASEWVSDDSNLPAFQPLQLILSRAETGCWALLRNCRFISKTNIVFSQVCFEVGCYIALGPGTMFHLKLEYYKAITSANIDESIDILRL